MADAIFPEKNKSTYDGKIVFVFYSEMINSIVNAISNEFTNKTFVSDIIQIIWLFFMYSVNFQ